MALPDAARHINTIAGGLHAERGDAYGGFSVPGIEITEERNSCCVDEGDVCRPKWANRQDHGTLSRLNRARQQHGEYVPYCREDLRLDCEPPGLRTTAYGDEPFAMDPFTSEGWDGGGPYAGQRRRAVQQLFQRAQQRRETRYLKAKLAVLEDRTRQAFAGGAQKASSVGVQYMPIAGRPAFIE